MPSAAAPRHPADLALALLGHDHWSVARDILAAVFKPNSRTAVKSCHASSKTFTSADAVVLAGTDLGLAFAPGTDPGYRVIDARREPRAREEHQREQRVHLGPRCVLVLGEQSGEPHRFLDEVGQLVAIHVLQFDDREL